jgi:hypothetical protein
VGKDAWVGDRSGDFFDGDVLARLRLAGVVVDDTGGEDVTLALVEVVKAGEEEGSGSLRGLREDEEEENGNSNGQTSLDDEEQLPSSVSTGTGVPQYRKSKETRYCRRQS